MSRDWKSSEMTVNSAFAFAKTCSIGTLARTVFQMAVAYDGLSVVVKTGGTAQACFESLGGLTTAQLTTMYSTPGTTYATIAGGATAACPDTAIALGGADDQSGTYSYFFGDFLDFATMPLATGGALDSTTYKNSAVDEDIVEFVTNGEADIAFFGYAHYASNAGALSLVAIDGVLPSTATIMAGTYPISRGIYMNVAQDSIAKAIGYLTFGLSPMGQAIVAATGYVPLPAPALAAEAAKIQGLIAAEPSQVYCGCNTESISILGSSTVKPIAVAWKDAFAYHCPATCTGAGITVEGGGSSNGARAMCGVQGQDADIGDMSRAWKSSEATVSATGQVQCAGDRGRTGTQLKVAYDGLTVVAKTGGTAATCFASLGGLTVAQLATMYGTPGTTFAAIAGGVTTACPATPILLSGADDQSGTYSYFFGDVMDMAPLADIANYAASYVNSHEDEDIVAYVTANPTAVGFFGYSYYAANAGTLTAVPIENSAGVMITPTSGAGGTISDGSYNPLSRAIYMNVDNSEWSKVSAYIDFGFSKIGQVRKAPSWSRSWANFSPS
jgi:phosphate transport system substrate-binding protein